jgi:hypothetical protein
MRKALIFTVLLALVTFALGSAAAGPMSTTTPTQVSGTSLFATCTADNVAGQTGTNFANSEVEPWIDVNPDDPDNIVGIWQQDRWSNGGARGLVAGVSSDGGTNWTQVVIPGITDCSGGIYDRSTDPWVSFSPDGTVHQLALSFNDVAPPFVEGAGGDFDHALLASRSTDGGLTWSAPKEVIRDLDANVFNDKQSITADPLDSNFVYGVWDRLVFPPSERASVIAGFRTSAFRGPAWFARSTDGGQNWEPARQIFDPGQNSQTIANQIAVLPDGDLVNLFTLIKFSGGVIPTGEFFTASLLRSEDRGVTWGPQARRGEIVPITIGRMRTIGVLDPDTGEPHRVGDIIPDIAVDMESGKLYAVWQDARFNNMEADAIAFSQSTDGGFTWSAPIKVNATPTGIPIENQQAFTASVHVADDGTVGVTYYDFRNNTAGGGTDTDHWLVHCHANCTNVANWSENHVAGPFDSRRAPDAGGFFLGDYVGLDNVGNTFTPFFTQTTATDPANEYYAKVSPSPSPRRGR